MHVESISAQQARQNMHSASHSLDEAMESINGAIREGSALHRGHTTVFLSREHIDVDTLFRIKRHFTQRGFKMKMDDRCHDRDTFALRISWYPA